jgi:hypothetical protein
MSKTEFSIFSIQSFAAWRLRLLLAAMLLFGSEILLWIDPAGRNILDWLLLAIGYIAIASLLLDLAVRFRVRNVFGLLALSGIYGLLNGLLLNPETALADMPRTLFTRVLGAHTFVGLLMLALFLQTSTPRRGNLPINLVVAALVGFGWGTWARWSATLLRPEAGDTSLTTLLIIAADVVVVILVLLFLRRSEESPQLRLRAGEWIGIMVVLTAFLLLRGLNIQIDTLSLALISTLIAFCLVLLWFLKREKGLTLFDGLNTVPVPIKLLAAELIAFVVAGIVGYGLPRGEGAQDPLFIITTLFTAFGLAWLPGVSLAMGAQAVARQVRAGKL